MSHRFKCLFCPIPFETQFKHSSFFEINNGTRSYVHQETVFSITCLNQITDASIKDVVGFFLKKGFKLLTLQYHLLACNVVPYPRECHRD